MKRVVLSALAAVAALSALPASANVVTIDFDGPTSFGPVADYYASKGVVFSEGALALSNDGMADTPSGNYYSNAPTMGGVMFTFDVPAYLNFAQGFAGEVSLFYSAAAALAGGISVYSGLNGTGSLLGSFDFSANANAGCADSTFCHWDRIALGFAGTGHSIAFSNGTSVAFDNVSLNAVPEPESYALMLAGLAALGVVARRQRKA
ncbi:MAG: PEP-CTERM sorting domain-containing protein [Mitsuaria chitosanitabida]|uniref:PEP-CTERM sorting domain-containing protein n=1 Tax=Roseateles chitosanitabidus TaxID=65048 RepID=UPI001B0DBE2E|nr:PEP-CTERM sorting domain-containing protein [Roseateles chitosanitabidus]MBO9686313.1 PEP-CTERM sorting domain-containing protein [Roseateles chitosanitabidus]